MNPQEPVNNNPHQRVSSDLKVMQPGEVVLCEIKRHPIGILGIYIGVTLMLGIVAYFAFGVLPSLASNGTATGDQLTQVGAFVLFILVTISLIYSTIATIVYWGNRWIVTSDSVTQIEQTSLFNRQSSQLALANIEDVTSEQKGIFSHIFNYGTLKAETAGHHGKFVFSYCPNPNFFAKTILEAREALGPRAHGHGGGMGQQPPAPLGPPTQPSSPEPQAPTPTPPPYPPQGGGFNSNL